MQHPFRYCVWAKLGIKVKMQGNSLNYRVFIAVLLCLSSALGRSESIELAKKNQNDELEVTEWLSADDLKPLISQAIQHHPAWQPKVREGKSFSVEPKSLQRLQLKPCEVDIETEVQGSGLQPRAQVNLRCASPLWSIVVPVTVKLMAPVAVINSAIVKGRPIAETHIDWVAKNLLELKAGYFTEQFPTGHYVAKRSIAPGTLLTAHLIKPADIIRKGDDVVILAKTPYLQVRMPGEALTNGQVGRQISVRNRETKVLIRAEVVASGLVEVNF